MGRFVANTHWRVPFRVSTSQYVTRSHMLGLLATLSRSRHWPLMGTWTETRINHWFKKFPGWIESVRMSLPPLAALLEEQFSWCLAFPLTNVTAFPSRRQRADHTQRSPMCAGTLDSFWGLIDSHFLLFFPFILVFVWNSVLSLHLLSGDEVILTKKKENYSKKGSEDQEDVLNTLKYFLLGVL